MDRDIVKHCFNIQFVQFHPIQSMVTTVLVMADTLKARQTLPVMRIPILTDHDILFNIQFVQFHPIQSMVTTVLAMAETLRAGRISPVTRIIA